MSGGDLGGLAQSVKQRLLNLSVRQGETVNVVLGLSNSRMKDYCDLWTLSQMMHCDGMTLLGAIVETTRRRQTYLPLSLVFTTS